MDDLIKTFYIDWKLLIAQAVNFTIVLVVLGIFAMKPLVKLMKDRQDKIEKSLNDAEKIQEKMSEIEKQREDEVKKGRKKAQEIIANSEQQSEEEKQKKIKKVQTESEKIVSDARAQIRAERTLMIQDVKQELGGLIALALGKITTTSIDDKAHKKLIDETIEDLSRTDINSQ